MNLPTRPLLEKALAVFLSLALLVSGCVLAPVPDPVPGFPQYRSFGAVEVPGGVYNVAGSNLSIHRADLSVDTRILAGTVISATWNSAGAGWHWSYQMRFDGETFVDREGAVYDASGLPDGSSIPGTWWVRIDSDTMKTKGGLVHDFDASGKLDAVYWTSDPYPRYRYVHLPDLVEQRECITASQTISECRVVFSLELGLHGPTRIVDAESLNVGVTREALYTYDILGRLRTARTPFEVDEGLPGTRYEYASGGMLTAIVDSEGTRIEYEWVFDRLLQVTRVGEGDPSHAFSYPQVVDEEASRYRVVHANPLGGRTRYTFTEEGHVERIERVDAGESMDIEWHPGVHRPSRIVDFDGTVLQLPDWVDDDPTTLIQPSGNVVQIVYAPDGVDFEEPLARPVGSVSDSLGPIRMVGYDPEGRPTSLVNGEGDATTLEYLGGEVSKATSPWGSTLELVSYAVHGHWRTAEVSSVPETKIQRGIDRIGNLIVPAAGIQEGGVLERAYDAARRVSALQVGAADEDGLVTMIDSVDLERRSDGQILSVSRPEGGDHVLEYDALGRVWRMRERVDGSWHDTVYTYDAADNVTSVEQPNGMREELDHDLYSRVVERRTLRNGEVEAFATFEWLDGRIDRWYDSVRDQWEIHAFDDAGRLEAITYSALGETLSYSYDLRSRIVRQTFDMGRTQRIVENDWDLADRLTRVFTSDAAGVEQDIVRLDYEGGRLLATDYGNGLRRENLYDAASARFAGYRTTDLATLAVVEETTVTRAAEIGPTRLAVTSRTETALATTQEEYWLGLGGSLQVPSRKIGARVFRWQGWTWVDGVLQDGDQRVYAWDELSNRVDDTAGNVLTYNAERNRLLAATVDGVSHTYTYDEAGFATSRDGLSIGWTAAGRLATVGPASGPLIEVEWDLAGRPVSVAVLGARRTFALFGGQVEYDAATGQTGWLHLTHVSLPFVGNERTYRHLDGLGNVGLTTDETGAVTSHRRYHPFGLDRVYGGESFGEDDPHGFVGGIELRHDGMETGLVVLGARVLDSDVGRFLSQDPVFQWVNQYTYAQGNPVDWVDLEGRHPVPKAEAPSDLAAQLDGFAGFLEASSIYTITLAALIGLTGDPVAVPVGAVGVVLGAGAAAVGKLADAVRAAQSASEAGSRMPPPPPTPPETGGQDKRLELEGDLNVLSDLIRFTGSLGVGSPGTSGCSPAGVSGSDRGVLELQLLALLATLVALQIIGNRGRRTELRRSSGGSFDGR